MVEPRDPGAATSVDKALDVLFHLRAAPAPVGPTELGRALGMPRSSIHRLLAALGKRDLVARTDDGRYEPGLGLVRLALATLEREPIATLGRPVLGELAHATGETAFSTVARGRRIVVLDLVEGAGVLRVAPDVGAEIPVHATAVGRLTLAFAPDAVPHPTPPWPRFTSRTPKTTAALDREIERARRRGWAANHDEWIDGLAAVAAPVVAGGRLQGCLVVAGPTSRLPPRRARELAEAVVPAASALAARIPIPEVHP